MERSNCQWLCSTNVHLTVFQSLPIDEIVVVTSPQDLVSMVVAKSINMARMMYIPIVGLVKNMAYVKCPNCNERIEIFKSKKENTPGLPILAEIPIDPNLASLVDEGRIEDYSESLLDKVIEKL